MTQAAEGGGGASITVDELQQFDGGNFSSAGSAMNSAANTAMDALNSVSTSQGQLSSWKGDAASEATAAINKLTQPLSSAAEILQSVQGPISGFVGTVNGAKSQLTTAVNGVNSLSFKGERWTYDQQGNVTAPAGPTAPTPPGNPPPGSAPDPSAAKEFAIESATYDQENAQYQQMVQQGENFQVQMQEALATASSADSSLAGTLSGSTTDAGQLSTAVAGGIGAGGATAALASEAAPINAADVNQTMTLINQAKAGNQQAINALSSGEYLEWAKDPLYATALLNQLSPKGLVQLPAALISNIGVGVNDNVPGVFSFLSRVLATGTTGAAQVGVNGSSYSVGRDWLQQLETAGRANSGQGYEELGNILGAASTPYSTSFMINVGQDLINWDNQKEKQGQKMVLPGGYWGQVYDRDPLVGLMTALSVNGPGGSGAPGAQALLDPNSGQPLKDQPPGGNLNYLITQHDWTARSVDPMIPAYSSIDYSDNGAALGQALKNAGTYGSSANPPLLGPNAPQPGQDPALDVTSAAVKSFGTYLQNHAGNAPSLTGLRQPMAQLLSQHYQLVEQAAHPTPAATWSHDNPPLVDSAANVAYVMSYSAADPQATAGLLRTAEAAVRNAPQTSAGQTLPGAALGFVATSLGNGLNHQGVTVQHQAYNWYQAIGDAGIGVTSAIGSAAAPEASPAFGVLAPPATQIWNKIVGTPASKLPSDSSGMLAGDLGQREQTWVDSSAPASQWYSAGQGAANQAEKNLPQDAFSPALGG